VDGVAASGNEHVEAKMEGFFSVGYPKKWI
jgi:hypothetical protein